MLASCNKEQTFYQDYKLEIFQTSPGWLLLPEFLGELAVSKQHVVANPNRSQRNTRES